MSRGIIARAYAGRDLPDDAFGEPPPGFSGRRRRRREWEPADLTVAFDQRTRLDMSEDDPLFAGGAIADCELGGYPDA